MSSSSDVIVIGGGIVGIACAHYLAKEGYGVTVIDQATIGAGCSHANCGFVCPSHVLPLNEPGAIGDGIRSLLNPSAAFRIKPQLRPNLYRWLFQFARRCTHRKMLESGANLLPLLESSIVEYRTLDSELRSAGEWKENGLLYVFRSEAGLDKFAHTDGLLTENYGVSARRIDGADLPEFDSALKHGLAGGFFYQDDASVRPDKLIRNWSTHLAEAGVRFVEHCQLEGVHRSGTHISELHTSTGTMTAQQYVIATGAWSGELSAQLNCRLPIEPGKGYSVTMSRPERCPEHPMLFPEHRVGVTPFEDSYRIGSMMEFAGFDTTIPARRIRQLRDSAAPYLEATTATATEETWYGWRPMTWDSLPVVGRIRGLDNALVATGHNMLGLTLAPATGRLIAELASGQPTHIGIDAFSPNRF